MSGDFVTLGVLDDPVFVPAEEGVTKIGGTPHWLCGEPPTLPEAVCTHCHTPLALMLSGDCPVTDGYDRVLFLFVCSQCGQDARVYRQKRLAAAPEPGPAALFSKDDLTAPPNTTADELLAAFGSFGAPAKPPPKPASGKKQKRQKETGRFPAFYLETFEEPEATISPDISYVMSTSADSTGSGMGEEDKMAVEVDPVLIEYNERMSRCPSQVLRYSRFGEPLLQDPVEFAVPDCPLCGAKRAFELELMPTVIYLLEPESPMDFGPILVYTCGNDCGEGSCEEFCFVSPP
jgi:pre-rRNA-processing protein TSR4